MEKDRLFIELMFPNRLMEIATKIESVSMVATSDV